MILRHVKKCVFMGMGLASVAMVLSLAAGVSAAVWSGASGTDSFLTTNGNWEDGVAPLLGPTDTSDLSFKEVVSGIYSPTMTADTGVHGISFETNTPSYFFSGPFALTFGNGSAGNIVNNSVNRQTINATSLTNATYNSMIQALEGDFVINAAVAPKSNPSDAANTNLIFDATEGKNIYLNVGSSILPGNTPGGAWATTTTNNSDKVLVQGGGRVIFGNLGSGWDGQLTVNGKARVTDPWSLGSPASSSGNIGRTVIGSGGTLEFFGGVTLGTVEVGSTPTSEKMVVAGRGASNDLPHILNVDGTNVIPSTAMITPTGSSGSNITYQADGGKLIFQNRLFSNSTVFMNLQFITAANAEIEVQGEIINGASTTNRNWNLIKKGEGKLTLTNPGNIYPGRTSIQGGTLALTGEGAVNVTAYIDVQPGATFDVSAKNGGYRLFAIPSGTPATLTNVQKLYANGTVAGGAAGITLETGTYLCGNGTVSGAGGVIAQYSAHVAPGDAIGDAKTGAPLPTAGKLTVSGNLDLTQGANFNWDLVAFKDDATGTAGTDFDQAAVGGDVMLGYYSNLNLNLLNGTADLGAFWFKNHSWKIIDGVTNSGNTGFATIAGPAFLSGAFTTELGTGADQGDVFLKFSTASTHLTWTGNAGNQVWDYSSAPNWKNDANQSGLYFKDYDTVTFNDNGVNNPQINITNFVTPGTVTVDNSAAHPYTFTGAGGITTYGFTKTGDGTVTFANDSANNFNTEMHIAAGKVVFSHPSYVMSAAVAAKLTGTGALEHAGAGVLTLSGNNSEFAGSITVKAGGTLAAGADNALGNASVTTIENGATLDINGKLLGNSTIHLAGAGADGLSGAMVNAVDVPGDAACKNVVLDADTALGGTVRWDIGETTTSGGTGVFSGNGHKLTKVGTNDIIIRNITVDNLGDIDIQAGRLGFEADAQMGDPLKIATVQAGAALSFWNTSCNKVVVSNGGTIRNGSGTNTFSGPIYLAMDSTFEIPSGTLIVSGDISGTTMVKTGSKQLRLTSNSNSYGATNITNGIVSIGDGGNSGSLGSGDVTIANGAVLALFRSGVYTVANNIYAEGTGRIDCNATNADFGVATLTGSISGTAPLTVSAGHITLSGVNSYTGKNTVNAGRLQFAKQASLPDSSWLTDNLIVKSGATLAFNVGGADEFTASDIDFLAGLGVASGGYMDGASLGLDTTNVAGGNFVYASNIANPNNGANVRNLVKLGSQTLTLTGMLSYTGTTTIEGGALAIENGFANTLTTISGGTLIVGAANPATSLTATSINVDTLSIGVSAGSAAAVPEPSTWLLLVIGSGMAAWFLRRKAG